MKTLFDLSQIILSAEHYWRYENSTAFVKRMAKQAADYELSDDLAAKFVAIYDRYKAEALSATASARPQVYDLHLKGPMSSIAL